MRAMSAVKCGKWDGKGAANGDDCEIELRCEGVARKTNR
jgi:hypothetical protein